MLARQGRTPRTVGRADEQTDGQSERRSADVGMDDDKPQEPDHNRGEVAVTHGLWMAGTGLAKMSLRVPIKLKLHMPVI